MKWIALSLSLSLLLSLLLSLSLSARASDCTATPLSTSNGPVVGVTCGGVSKWLGVPYGAAQRFAAPTPPPSWTVPRDASAFGPGCLQPHHNADVPALLAEDCLNLNVFAPAAAAASPRPAMVFFHGGGFAEGSNQGPFGIYDAASAAATGLVVLTVNYRLDALGFLAAPPAVSGNYGIQDQRLALHWLRDNAAALGVDPQRVTIWGESAGAMSVGVHLISPLSRGLFSAGIMQSNPASWLYRTPARQSFFAPDFAAALNCTVDDIACLRAAPTDAVMHAMQSMPTNITAFINGNWPHLAYGFLPWTPVVDGTDEFPMQILDAIKSGQYAKGVPLLVGTNQDEGATFLYAGVPLLPMFVAQLAMSVEFGSSASKVLDFYAPLFANASADGREPIARVMTDYWFRCSSQNIAALLAESGTPVWLYRHEHIVSFPDVFSRFGLPAECATRTCHAAELPFIFNNTVLNYTFTAAEQDMANSAVHYWTSFALSHDPNSDGTQSVKWPPFDRASRGALVLSTPVSTEFADASGALCGFWDSLGYGF